MKEQSGMKAAIKNLRALADAEPSPEYFDEFFKQVRSENNDRGAAILTATNTENSLRYALSKRLAVGKDNYEQLFGMNGPMGTFDLKIRMAKALKIFGPEDPMTPPFHIPGRTLTLLTQRTLAGRKGIPLRRSIGRT
jgi:hypothetical protein